MYDAPIAGSTGPATSALAAGAPPIQDACQSAGSSKPISNEAAVLQGETCPFLSQTRTLKRPRWREPRGLPP